MKIKKQEAGFTIIEAFIVIMVVIIICLVGKTLLHNQSTKQNAAYFRYLDSQVALFDVSLKQNTGDQLSYDANNDCGYGDNTDFSNGPRSCGINRAYYFPASNVKTAIKLDHEIVASFKKTFPAPRYKYPKEDFEYFNYVRNAQDQLIYVGQPNAGFEDKSGDQGEGTFVVDKGTSIGNARCSFDIEWPNESTYTGNNFSFPIRNNSNLVEMVFGCSADATKNYFPFKGFI
jgi:hypothetical protein